MKIITTLSLRTVLTAISLLLLFESCSNKSSFLNSSIVPAAEGKVKITNDKNHNYVIDLEVIRLAEPQRLTPPKNVYVVWMETKSGEMKNIGQLETSSGFMSKAMKSSLKTVTSFKPAEIVISAEDDATQRFPGLVVLRTGKL
jgi:hypothetical protein